MEETIKTDSKTEEVSGWLAFFMPVANHFAVCGF